MLGGERQGKEATVLKKGIQVKGKICKDLVLVVKIWDILCNL